MSNGNNFASGGYTGAGGKYEPAGIVHAGSFVIAADVKVSVNDIWTLYPELRPAGKKQDIWKWAQDVKNAAKLKRDQEALDRLTKQ